MGEWILRLAAHLTPLGPKPLLHVPAEQSMPVSRPLVSVIIPCYNYAQFLTDAVESALDQRGVDVEIIVVDDCSTDNSRQVAERLAKTDTRVRVLANPVNLGHVRSFNAGWEASAGVYVVKLDADDLLTPDSLSRAAALFEAHSTIGLVYGHPRHFSTLEPPGARIGRLWWTVWKGHDWLSERCRLGVSAITNPEMVMRSSILRHFGPMDPAVPFAPDMEISLRISAVSDVGYVGGADQALHREHSASMSETDGSGTLTDLHARRDAFERMFERVGDRLCRPRDLLRQAQRALAADALRYASARQDRRRASIEVDDLLTYARATAPESSSWRVLRRIESRCVPRRFGRVAATLRRVLRRLRHHAYYLRWTVRGV